MLQRPKKKWGVASCRQCSLAWEGRRRGKLASGVLAFHRAAQRNSICLTSWGASIPWRPERERRHPAAVAPENLQCHKQAPEGAKDYELLKNHQASLIEKLHTQTQRSHIPPEKVSEAPRIFSWAHVWGSSPVWSKAIKIWKGGCSSIRADPNTKLRNMKKQGNLAQTEKKKKKEIFRKLS